MADILVITGEPPYGTQRLYTALRFSLAAISAGHEVKIFLLEDAVWAAKKGQSPAEIQGTLGEKMPDAGGLLERIIRQGGDIRLCGVCCQERGIGEEDLIPGTRKDGMMTLVERVVNADKVVSF